MESTNTILSNLSNVEGKQLELLEKNIKHLSVKKTEVLQKQGDTQIKSYYVKKGLLRSYTIDEKGKEHIYMFAPEGWIVSDMESQSTGAPAQLFVDALEDSDIEMVDKDIIDQIENHSQLSYSSKHVKRFINRISVLQRRVILLMSASAKERYLDFLNTYPNMPQRVPQKMIASYLGITPEALSKIKSELLLSKSDS